MKRFSWRFVVTLLATLVLAGCGTMPDWLSASGPSREQVMEQHDSALIEGIRLVEVNDRVARQLAARKRLGQFSEVFPAKVSNRYLVAPGDIIEVSVWEAPPAMLFGGLVLDPGAGATTTRVVTFPEQMVTPEGVITMPFAGWVPVKGRTTQQIETDIVARLTGKAHQPQVLVRVIKNNTANVTIVGDVKASTQMPLTPRGERLLDALAAGGGVTEPVSRMAIQLSRDKQNATMPLDAIIRDPRQNVALRPGDVVTALYQTQSFSALGASGRNEEIPFEARGISLAQALARAGGLLDNRADARGVFVFRFEDASTVAGGRSGPETVDGTIPVVYQVNLRDPATLFVTQNFPVQDQDVIYVANSPETEFSKFLRLIVTVTSPASTLNRALQ